MNTTRRSLLIACFVASALAASGCGLGDDGAELNAGDIDICYDAPTSTDNPNEMGELHESLDGTVVYEGAASEVNADLSCDPTRVLQVDVDGDLWSIGYVARDADGNDITPVIGFVEDEAIHLSIEHRMIWGYFNAFAAEAKSGTLLAMNDGGGAELPDSALDGMSVSVGSTYGATRDESCGVHEGHTLVFDAQTTTELRSGEEGHVELSSGRVDVTNVASWSFQEGTLHCTDTWGRNAWMATRPLTQ